VKFTTFYGLLILLTGIGALIHWTIGTAGLILLYGISMKRI
jgi:hypothetical protein